MKKQLLVGLVSLAAASACWANVATSFVNDFETLCPPTDPPQVDAYNFVNNSILAINLLDYNITAPYATADTLTYTNYGLLACDRGFRFDKSSGGIHYRAASVYNEVGAVINAGGTNIQGLFSGTNALPFSLSVGAQLLANASNIVNRGTIEVSSDALLSLQGNSLDLVGGLLNAEGFESGLPVSFINGFGAPSGVFDSYWGLGQNTDILPASYFGSSSAFTPSYWVTNRYYSYYKTGLSLSAAPAYENIYPLDASNTIKQVVYVQNFNPAISNNVYYVGATPIVEWLWQWTNNVTSQVIQDGLLLQDDILSVTNILLETNGVAAPNTAYRASFITTNYYPGFIRNTFSNLYGLYYVGNNPFPPTSPGLSVGFFPTGKITNEFTAYQAIFAPTSVLVPEVANRTYSNSPGRIELYADKTLDLSSSRVAAENFLKISAPNNFVMDNRTRILTYAADYNLGSSSGSMTISNLISPTCPRPNGTVSLFTARWTNVVTTAIPTTMTNIYQVLLVDSRIAPTSPTVLQNLALHSSDVYISDVLNVVSNLTIDAANVTIVTNDSSTAQSPNGQLNLLSGNILWTNAFPRLRTLTNYGNITVNNSAFFGGVRFAPYYPTSLVEPYWDFVNYGTVSNQGCFVWATNFQNQGVVDAGPLSVTVQASSATLSNGVFNAPTTTGDITVYARDLMVSNHNFLAGRKLTLAATNSLNDGGAASSNFWTAGAGGFNLLIKPTGLADLRGTTISNSAVAWARVVDQWSATDLGAVASGFNNNAAVGRVVFEGGANSQFVLQGPGGSPAALYVDCLILRDYATNRDGSGNLASFLVNTNFKVYYAQALVVNGNGTTTSIAEKLNHRNNGAFNWVSSYAGAFSCTNLVYPDGSTNTLNLALVTSCNLDSDSDGIPNCQDPTPVLVPSLVQLKVTPVVSASTNFTKLSWQTVPYATNTIYYKGLLGSGSWQVLTNFVTSPYILGPATVVDTLTRSNRYYRVRVDLVQP